MMEEEREKGNSFPVKDFIITLAVSALMGLSGFFSLFMALPLLSFSSRHTRKETIVTFVAVLCILVAHSMYVLRGSAYYPFMVLMDLYIPVSLSAAGMIWTCTKGKRVDLRLILSVLPALFIVLVCAVFLCADRALFTSVYNGYKDAFVPLLEEIFQSAGITADVELVFLIMMTLACVIMLPLVTGAICVTLFLFEGTLHSREGDWDEKLLEIEFDQSLVWLLILSLVVSLVSRLISVPVVVFILSMSLTATLFIIYGVQGFSVLYSWIKRANEGFRSRVLFFILLFTGLFVPGLNLIVLLGVPVLGILENFFDLKKRKKE